MASILDLFPGAAAERERVRALSQQDLQGQLGAFADQSANALIPFYGAGQAASQGDYGTAAAMGGMDAAGFMLPVAFRRGIAGMFQPKPEPAPAPRRAPAQPQPRPIEEVAREREMGNYQGSRVEAGNEYRARFDRAAMDAAQGNMTPDAMFFSQRLPDQFAAQTRQAENALRAQPEQSLQVVPDDQPGLMDSDSDLVRALLGDDPVPSSSSRKPPKEPSPYRDLKAKDRIELKNSLQARLSSSNQPPSRLLETDDVTRNEIAQSYAQSLRDAQGVMPDPQKIRGRLDGTLDQLTTIYKSAGGGDAGEAALRNQDLTNRAFGRRGTLSQAGVGVGIGASAAVSDEDFLAEMRAFLDEFNTQP